MTRAVGGLDKALAEIAIQTHRDAHVRHLLKDDSHTGEYMQQVQFPFYGHTVNQGWVFSDKEVTWELPFLWAPAQRQVPFEKPHFWYGVEHTLKPQTIVVVTVSVIEWGVTPENWLVGCVVRCAAQAPAVDISHGDVVTNFATNIHLTFQGYGTNTEGDDFDNG